MPESQPQILLFISIAALLVGPILFYLMGVSQKLWQGIDAFVLVAVGGIVFFHILPDAYLNLGWPALAIAFTSLFLPALFEKITSHVARTAHNVTLILALIGVVLHAFTDGIALIAPETTPGHLSGLPLAVILHRIPDGITIWWLLRPTHGRKMAIRTLIIISVATVLGFYFGQNLIAHFSNGWFGLFEALLGGALLHVIFHASFQQGTDNDQGWRWPQGTGALLAILGLVLFFHGGPHDHRQAGLFTENFINLALTSAPALALAYLISGVLDVFLNKAPVNWLSRGNLFTQALKGMATGLPLPLCSCGVIPVYRTLVLKGVPLSAGLAFLIATPELSIDALILSLPLLGGQMTGIRLVFAGMVALIAGYAVAKKFRKHTGPAITQKSNETSPAKSTLPEKLKSIFKHGFGNAFDDTIPWILVGITIAALVAPVITSHDLFGKIPDMLEVPLFALLGMPMYVCASGATPLVAVLMMGGVSPGAALAFLLTGPASNATTYGILSQLHGKKIAVHFMLTMLIVTVILGMGTNLVFPQIELPNWSTHEHGTWHTLQQVCLAILASTLAVSLLRNGPRKLLEKILRFDTHVEDKKQSHDHSNHAHDGHHPSQPEQDHAAESKKINSCCH